MPTPPIVVKNSTAVTSAPRRFHTEPYKQVEIELLDFSSRVCANVEQPRRQTNSKPITPAPIKINFLGTSVSESAPVDDTI
jgi:hypothetical protein